MTTLPELTLDYRQILDHTTVIFGESGTGKSTIMVDLLYLLQPFVEQIIVVSPTDKQNRTYSKGIVPIPCIHYTIGKQLLEDIWARQSALVEIYTRASDIRVLESLYDRIDKKGNTASIIADVRAKLNTRRAEIRQSDPQHGETKIEEMEAEYNRFIELIYKQIINENRSYLLRLNLSKEERLSLTYLNLNPRLVLVFDDCTDQLALLKTHPIIQKMFYQGRWAYITFIIACHTDVALHPAMKKNAFVQMFTNDTCAFGFFNRKSSDLGKDAVARANSAIKAAFTTLAPHQKLVWMREEKKFYRYTATKHKTFSFGSPMLWAYCDRIKVDNSTVDTSNKYIRCFDID